MDANIALKKYAKPSMSALMDYPTNSRTYTVFPFSSAKLISETNSTYSFFPVNGFNFVEKFFQILSNTKPFDPDFKRILDENFFDLLA